MLLTTEQHVNVAQSEERQIPPCVHEALTYAPNEYLTYFASAEASLR